MESVCGQVGLAGVVVLVSLVGVPFVGRCRVFDRGAGLGGPSLAPVRGLGRSLGVFFLLVVFLVFWVDTRSNLMMVLKCEALENISLEE